MSTAPIPRNSFKKIDFPIKTLGNTNKILYRVYEDPKKYALIEAASAQEALEKCGLKSPFRIDRHIPTKQVIIQHVHDVNNAVEAP